MLVLRISQSEDSKVHFTPWHFFDIIYWLFAFEDVHKFDSVIRWISLAGVRQQKDGNFVETLEIG